VRLFQRNLGFLKLFPDKWRFLKGFEACKIFVQRSGGFFFYKSVAFVKITSLLKDIFRDEDAFLN
jgi:hypothetical protein